MKKLIHVLPLLILIFISLSLFLPKLGQTPLKSWDEAWYAEIARNILKRNEWFLLWWNGFPYYDHPPVGFWLIALSFKFFGISEFTARLPSALAGIGSVVLVYLLGKEWFNQTVGFIAGIILATTPWFWLRSRQGNLDIILTFFILLSIWLATKLKENKKNLPLFSAVLAFSFLTKTIIAAGIIPLLIYLIFKKKERFNQKNFLLSIFVFLVIILPWYFINWRQYGLQFIDRNIFVTGLKLPGYKAIFSGLRNSFPFFSFKNTFYNLHMGILLWYKPFLVSLFVSLFFLKNKSFKVLYLWLLPYLLIFSLSSKTELWHLIIIYPVVALLIAAFLQNISKIVPLAPFLILIFVIWTGGRIVKGLYKDIVKNQPLNDEVILSRLAGKNEGVVYIDDDYWPTAVFYSQKNVVHLVHAGLNLPEIFEKSEKPFLVLTKKWILERDHIDSKNYEILEKIGERVLIKSPAGLKKQNSN